MISSLSFDRNESSSLSLWVAEKNFTTLSHSWKLRYENRIVFVRSRKSRSASADFAWFNDWLQLWGVNDLLTWKFRHNSTRMRRNYEWSASTLNIHLRHEPESGFIRYYTILRSELLKSANNVSFRAILPPGL